MTNKGLRGSTCRQCARFIDDPADLERELPAFRILGSAYASVRGSAGICRQLDRFMDPIAAAGCPFFEPRSDRTEP